MNNEGIQLIQREDGVWEEFNPFCQIVCQTEEDFNKIQDALNKQTPKKVKHYGDSEDYTIECPNAECEINLNDEEGCGFNYCPYCGQRLDWSEEE